MDMLYTLSVLAQADGALVFAAQSRDEQQILELVTQVCNDVAEREMKVSIWLKGSYGPPVNITPSQYN